MTGPGRAGTLRARERAFAWGPGHAPLLMAVLNVTPDSFSDGGSFAGPAQAAAHGDRCVADGAAILDVGGESTRPGATRVPAAVQVERTVPVVRALAVRHAVSIDTTLSAVAAAALDAGACIVNDVSGATEDPAMLDVVAAAGAAIVLMHRRFAPGDDRWSHEHDPRRPSGDAVAEVADMLAERVDAACRAGIGRDRVAVDPGLGFGKDVGQNVALVRGLDRLGSIGVPVLVGASRKSFLGALVGESDPAHRDAASVGAAIAAASRGAAILRVHDVRAHAQAVAAWFACARGTCDGR